MDTEVYLPKLDKLLHVTRTAFIFDHDRSWFAEFSKKGPPPSSSCVQTILPELIVDAAFRRNSLRYMQRA